MSRKPPLRTYQKKKPGQSSFIHSHPSLWAPRSFSKRISTNEKKNKPSLHDEKDIGELSSSYLETTFDKIAKNAKLPPPPQQESHNTINFSSDVTFNELSPIKTNVYLAPAKSKTRKKMQRKPPQSRMVHPETEVVLNNSEKFFTVQPMKSSKIVKNRRERKNRYLSKRKKDEVRMSNSSCDNSDNGGNVDTDVSKVKNKRQKKNTINRRNPGRKQLKVRDLENTSLGELSAFLKFQVTDEERGEKTDYIDKKLRRTENKQSSLVGSRPSVNTGRISTVSNRTRSKAVIKNSPALQYVKNFRRYSASKSEENNDLNLVDSNKQNRIPTRKQYVNVMQPKLTRMWQNEAEKATGALNNFNYLETRENNAEHKKHFPIKPCCIVLFKCDANTNPIPSRKESVVVSENYNMHSSEDIFQSSISNASYIEPESHNAVRVRSHKSEETQQTQCSNQSDFIDSSNLNTIPSLVEIRRKTIERNQQCIPNLSLNFLKCSTPINTHVHMDKTINRLSPIIANDEIFHDTKVQKSSAVNCNANNTNSSKECSDFPKTSICCRNARKRLSISYDEDKSLKKPDEYCKKDEIERISVGNVANCKYSSRLSNVEQVQSSTSQIQESLEILELDLENSISKYRMNVEARFSRKKIILTESNGSNRILESTNKNNETSEFIAQSQETCSQLTPVGIITTRSGRQLKLNTSAQDKFSNDSNDSNIHPDSLIEIIDDSEITTNKSLKNRITNRQRQQFTLFKSDSQRNTSGDHKIIQPAVDISKIHTSNNSTTYRSMNFEASVLGNRRNSTSSPVVADPQIEYTTLSNHEIMPSIIECTKDCDSVNTRSLVDLEVTNPSHFTNNDDSGSEWTTMSSSGASIDPCTEDKTQNFSLELNTSLLISDPKKDNDLLSKSSNNSFKSAPDQSSAYTDIALAERRKLLSTRINTRKRREMLVKPVMENMRQVVKDQTTIQISDHSELTTSMDVYPKNEFYFSKDYIIENTVHSLEEQRKSDLFKQPFHINMNGNLQPLVVLDKLEDPLRITTNQKKDWDFGLTAIHETSNKTFRIISEHSNDSFTSNDSKVDENSDFEKSDPLYCPSEKSRNSSFDADIISVAQYDCSFPEFEANMSEIIHRKSIFESFKQCLLNSAEKDRPSLKANQLEKAGQRKSSSRFSQMSSCKSSQRRLTRACVKCALKHNYSVSKLELSESEIPGRQSLFLKPGKKWARSLSILNNIQDTSDLGQLSAGKGKNWRKSVHTVLAMQQEGVCESCFGKNEDSKEMLSRFRTLSCSSIPETTPCSEEQSAGSASPSRFIRRMSIRVVPDNKRLSRIEDTSFLEAYGMTVSKSRKTLSKRTELECDKTIICDVQREDAALETIKTEQIITARDVVLHQKCGQDDYLSFTKCFPTEYLEHCRKIGEGVYGEVFLYEHRRKKSVIKIIPIEGDDLVNGERQKRFDEILSEIVIAKELHNLRFGGKYQTHGFVEVKNINCIKGKYPEKLIELWKAYDYAKGSDNDCPAMFDQNQLYIVLELAHGGEDLEAFVFSSAVEAHALFVQTAVALAVAEQSLEFEHRDLHWGNILISETKDSEVTYRLNNKEYTYPTKGLQVSIIDFTLSRMSCDGCCIFNDLALDPALFTAQGDYQFEIYRLMRDKVGNNWQRFEPFTNVLWLHYIIDKTITSLRYKRKYAKGHKEAMYSLHELKAIVLNYESAFDFVTKCEQITNLQRKNTETETTVEPIKIDSDRDDRK